MKLGVLDGDLASSSATTASTSSRERCAALVVVMRRPSSRSARFASVDVAVELGAPVVGCRSVAICDDPAPSPPSSRFESGVDIIAVNCCRDGRHAKIHHRLLIVKRLDSEAFMGSLWELIARQFRDMLLYNNPSLV